MQAWTHIDTLIQLTTAASLPTQLNVRVKYTPCGGLPKKEHSSPHTHTHTHTYPPAASYFPFSGKGAKWNGKERGKKKNKKESGWPGIRLKAANMLMCVCEEKGNISKMK